MSNNTPTTAADTADHHLEDSVNELKALVRDAEKALSKGGDFAEGKLDDLRDRLRSALDKGNSLYQRTREVAIERGEQADRAVRTHPYESIAIALGAGVLLGYFVTRR